METMPFRNPRYPNQRIIVTDDGRVLNSRTRKQLDDAENPRGVAFFEFRELINRLNQGKALVRPVHKGE